MKNKWPIRTTIALLVLSNLVMASYIVGKNKKWMAHIWPGHEASTAVSKTAVIETPKFKGDSELQVCYESLLRREPAKDEGQVVVHWRVGKDGQVDFLKLVHSDWSDDVFTGCVLNKIKDAHFPPKLAHNGALVAHTFNFHPRSPASLNYSEQ